MGEVFPGLVNTNLLVDSLLVVFAVFTTAFLTCSFIVPLLIKFSPRLGLIDLPGPRSIHSSPVPRAGGIAVFLSFHLSILVLLYSPIRKFGALDLDNWWFSFAIASTLIFLVGLIDDFKRLSAPAKLIGQIIASYIAYLCEIRLETIFGYTLPEPFCLLATIAWFVMITNAFNLVDGLDGLASGLTALASLGLAGSLIFRGIYVESVLLIGFIGSLVAFLRFNVNPARIFLGDSGSNLAGFTLAFFMLSTGSKHLAFAQQWIVMLIMIVPILDTLLAIWRRSLNYALNKSNGIRHCSGVMTGDLEHIHHRLKRLGFDSRDSVGLLYLVNAIFILISLISLPLPHYTFSIIGLTALIFTLAVLMFIPPQEIRQSAQLIYVLFIKSNSSIYTRIFRLCFDALLVSIALFIAFLLCHPEYTSGRLAWFWREVGPSWIVVALAISALLSYENKKNCSKLVIAKLLLAPLAIALFALNISLIIPVKSWQALTVEISMFAIVTILTLSTKKIILGGLQRFIEAAQLKTIGS